MKTVSVGENPAEAAILSRLDKLCLYTIVHSERPWRDLRNKHLMVPTNSADYRRRRQLAVAKGAGLGNPHMTDRICRAIANGIMAGGEKADKAIRVWRKLSHWSN